MTFVNFDRPRLLRTVKLMKELGKEHQIVLLTCHQTIADLFEPNQIRYLSQRLTQRVKRWLAFLLIEQT